MKLKTETLTTTWTIIVNDFFIEEIREDYIYTRLETPKKLDTFGISDEEKKENLFAQIMDVIGLDLTDD